MGFGEVGFGRGVLGRFFWKGGICPATHGHIHMDTYIHAHCYFDIVILSRVRCYDAFLNCFSRVHTRPVVQISLQFHDF